jgi:hypothetical protein
MNSNGFAEGFAVGQSNSNNGWGFGNGGELLWIIVLFALLGGGWGGNGWNNGGGQMNYELGRVATTNDVASGFTNSAIMGNQREVQLTLSNMQNYINQGFSGLNMSVMQGFNDTQRQIADCCCLTQRGIDNINFNMERNTCNITNVIKDEFCGLYKYLDNKEIQKLRDANNSLRDENRWLRENNREDQRTGYLAGLIKNAGWGNDCGCGNCNGGF